MKKAYLRTPAILLILTSVAPLVYSIFSILALRYGMAFAGSKMGFNLMTFALPVLSIAIYWITLTPGRDSVDKNTAKVIGILALALGGYSMIGTVQGLLQMAALGYLLGGLGQMLSNLAYCLGWCRFFACIMVARYTLGSTPVPLGQRILMWLPVGFMLVIFVTANLALNEELRSSILAIAIFVVLALIIVYMAYVKPTAAKIERMSAEQLADYRDKQARSLGMPLLYCWAGGIVLIVGGFFVQPREQMAPFFSFGVTLLVIAILGTIAKRRKVAVMDYAIIDIPSNWPKDCFFADYGSGINGGKKGGGIRSAELAFFEACKAAGIRSVDKESDRARAELVAKKSYPAFIGENLVPAFRKGQTDARANEEYREAQSEAESLKSTRIEELELLKKTLKYYGLMGAEKRRAMLSDLVAQAKLDQESAKMAQTTVMHTTQQKELDWAVFGGIASGIAGPVAGVAEAVRVQARNAEIRAQNKANRPITMAGIAFYSGLEKDARARQTQLEAEMGGLSTKLVAEDDKAEVFRHLQITEVSSFTSKTGAVIVDATFTMDPNYRIFGDVKPRIDGCVAARIDLNGEQVGSAYFVFPLYGVDAQDGVRLRTACTKTTIRDAAYTVRFEPEYLFAIEK